MALARGVFIRILIGSAFGLGLLPIAPGSWAALLGVAMHVATALLLPESWLVPVMSAALIVVAIANHVLTPWAQRYWGKEDPGNFVLDEIAGYLVVPILFHHGQLWQVALWGFLTFRVLDIIKFPPARQIDRRMTNAWGILLDDLVSGVYAVGCLYVMRWIGPQLGIAEWLIS